MWSCAVRDCGAVRKRSKQTGRLAYTFPTKDMRVRVAWLQFASLDENTRTTSETRICADHFAEEDYERWGFGGKRKLREEAIPRFRTKHEKEQYARDSQEKNFCAAEYLRNVYARIGLEAEPLSISKKGAQSCLPKVPDEKGSPEDPYLAISAVIPEERVGSLESTSTEEHSSGLGKGATILRPKKQNRKPHPVEKAAYTCLVCGNSETVDKRRGARAKKWISTADLVLPTLMSPVNEFLVDRDIVDPSAMAAAQGRPSMCSTCWSLLDACDRSYGRFCADVERLKQRQCSTLTDDHPLTLKLVGAQRHSSARAAVDCHLERANGLVPECAVMTRMELGDDAERNGEEDEDLDLTNVLEPAVNLEVLSDEEVSNSRGEADFQLSCQNDSQRMVIVCDGVRPSEPFSSPRRLKRKAELDVTEGLSYVSNCRPKRRKEPLPAKAVFSNLDLIGFGAVSTADTGMHMPET